MVDVMSILDIYFADKNNLKIHPDGTADGGTAVIIKKVHQTLYIS